MPMYNDIVWREKRKQRNWCCEFSHRCKICSKSRARTLVVSLGLYQRRNGAELTHKPNGEWDRVTDIMMINFSERGHSVFRRSSAFERGDLKSKGKGKLSFHFCGDDETAKVALRAIISVDQLSVYRALADMCEELAWNSPHVRRVR